MDEQKRFRAKVSGMVQGVGFRWFVQDEARLRSIAGYVRNLPDGSVEVDAQGTSESIQCLITVLRSGPSASVVAKLELEWLSPLEDKHSFEIRF